MHAKLCLCEYFWKGVCGSKKVTKHQVITESLNLPGCYTRVLIIMCVVKRSIRKGNHIVMVAQNRMARDCFSLHQCNSALRDFRKCSCATLVWFNLNCGPIEYISSQNCIKQALHNRTERRIKIVWQQCEPSPNIMYSLLCESEVRYVALI